MAYIRADSQVRPWFYAPGGSFLRYFINAHKNFNVFRHLYLYNDEVDPPIDCPPVKVKTKFLTFLISFYTVSPYLFGMLQSTTPKDYPLFFVVKIE
jgi:hypothetical protein